MTYYQRAAAHIIRRGLNGRGTVDGAPNSKALRAEPFSSTEGVLADIAAALCDLSVGSVSAADRLDDRQWRVIEEALAIAHFGRIPL